VWVDCGQSLPAFGVKLTSTQPRRVESREKPQCNGLPASTGESSRAGHTARHKVLSSADGRAEMVDAGSRAVVNRRRVRRKRLDTAAHEEAQQE
jgi:hypothetical protein